MTREEIHIGDVVKYDDHPNYRYKITRKQPNGSFVLNCIKGSYHCIPYALADKMTLVKRQPEPEFSPDKSLEEAAHEYSFDSRPSIYGQVDVIDAFKAGAEWQYQKDREEFAKIKAKTWCEGFDAHKEQMLKDAVEGEVGKDGILTLSNGEAVDLSPSLDKIAFGLQPRQKVRIVVLKAEEE